MEYIMSLHAKERIERRKISMDVLEETAVYGYFRK